MLLEILGCLTTTQDNLFRLLEARQAPVRARQLYLLAGVMSGLFDRVSHDLGDFYDALTQARNGFLCDDCADHNGLRAMIGACETVITFWENRLHDAVSYAQSGMQFASAARNTTLVWLVTLEARAWARLGNAAKACELVEHAERMRDKVRKDELDDLGGVCACDRSRQLYVGADALPGCPRGRTMPQVRRRGGSGLRSQHGTGLVIRVPGWLTHSPGDRRIRMGELDGAARLCAGVRACRATADKSCHAVWRRVHVALSSSPLAGGHPELAEKIKVFAGTHHVHNVGADQPGTTLRRLCL